MNEKYGHLTPIKYEYTDKNYAKYYLFKCDCGNEKVISMANVKSGKIKSCGCYRKKVSKDFHKNFNNFIIKEDCVIGITNNTKKEFYIDYEDYLKIKDITWYEQKNGYIANKQRKMGVTFLHRYITNCPKGKIVDHINHNVKDNRKSNLRICNYSENAMNKKIVPNGIAKIKRNNNIYYSVQLKYGGKTYQGCFKNYEDAIKKRNEILQKRHDYIAERKLQYGKQEEDSY